MVEVAEIVGVVFILILFGSCVGIVVDGAYKYPQAAENANEICKSNGYDSYDSFSRIGIFSTTPVAIKCKYVDSYQDIDMRISKSVTQ